MPSFTSLARDGDEESGGGGVLWRCLGSSRGTTGASALMYMGPCAEMLGINVMVAFWLCIAQLPVALTLALHMPTVHVDLYTTGVRTAMDPRTNRTAVVAPDKSAIAVASYEHNVGASGFFVLNAALIAIFGTMTMSFCERGLVSRPSDRDDGIHGSPMAAEEFVAQNIGMLADPTFRTWNQAFVGVLLSVHVTSMAAMCSPVSWDALAIYALLVALSICSIVQPLDNFDSDACKEFMEHASSGGNGGSGWIMASVSAQNAMVRMGLFAASVAFLLSRIPIDPQACRAQLALLLACIDGFLLMGHLWDRVPSLQVALNCRLMYACLVGAFNAAVLLGWAACGETPFILRE